MVLQTLDAKSSLNTTLSKKTRECGTRALVTPSAMNDSMSGSTVLPSTGYGLTEGAQIIDNSTNATGSIPPMHYYPMEVKIAMRTIQGLTAIIGTLGNLLVCVVILTRNTRSSIRLYLLSLAVADLGILLVIFPALVVRMEPIPWPFGVFGCTYVVGISEMFYPASIWTMTLIALSRYVNITATTQVAPLGHTERTFRNKRTHISLACLWVASFLSSSVPLFVMLEYDPVRKICITKWPKQNTFMYMQLYLLTLTLIYYFIPLAVICATYWGIRQRLNRSIRFHRTIHTVGSSQNAMQLHSIKAKKILTPLVLAFASLMLPITIARLLLIYSPNIYRYRYFQVMYDVFLFCILLNSAIDPLIYYIVNSDFRKGIQEIIYRCRGHEHAHEPATNTIVMSRQ
ncbi:predicted protein [Nematostella vectensis]|uniref:G-protein coupled receptors family 1 profile domain-containing protein n=1 Tax=Nematostella vectensis TaxID=45351 RepID=A7SSQ1_NEMVE|nr:predicted protein [Nematostella vectensis]|eukprot:XP_001625348.1 predicted protein [Nematostella vectensis]